MRKTLIVLGDNNFWYATEMIDEGDENHMQAVIKQLKLDIQTGRFDDQIDMRPNELHLYVAQHVHTEKL